MIPTHRHADGGLYRLAAKDIAGKDDGDWQDGVLYQCCTDGKMRWTTKRRFEDRFKYIDPKATQYERFNLFEDEDIVGTIVFCVTEVDDIRHLLIKGKASPGKNDEVFLQVKRVLESQAEIMTQGLHRNNAPLIDFLGDVITFHRKFAQFPNSLDSHLLPEDLFDFRAKFHLEESQEYKNSGEAIYAILETGQGPPIAEERRHIVKHLADQLDAVCDALFVIFGTVDIQFDRATLYSAWRRVMSKNMQKVRAYAEGDDRSKRDSKFDIVKPAGWTPPDHTDLIKYGA